MARLFRRVICALLFTATTINYLDRWCFGTPAPDLQRSLHWNEVQWLSSPRYDRTRSGCWSAVDGRSTRASRGAVVLSVSAMGPRCERRALVRGGPGRGGWASRGNRSGSRRSPNGSRGAARCHIFTRAPTSARSWRTRVPFIALNYAG
jgi:hypothetical protein